MLESTLESADISMKSDPKLPPTAELFPNFIKQINT